MMNEMQLQALPLKGMRDLVTGGAQGIGAGICLGLATAGAEVAIVDLNVDKAQYLATQILKTGCRAIAVSADISTENGCQQAVASTIGDLDGLDIW
jgi:NAD(P)-dependent dehydrogenase (short-subunit alcohol dehydrogenase family)